MSLTSGLEIAGLVVALLYLSLLSATVFALWRHRHEALHELRDLMQELTHRHA